jgi:hypothetical protein
MLLVFMAFYSELINSRFGATIVLQLWALPLLIALHSFNKDTSQWIYFAVVSLIVGYPSVHPIQVAWASRNSYSVRTRCVTDIQNLRKINTNKDNRTVSASLYNMCVQLSSIISVSNIDRHRLQTNVSTQRQIYIVQMTNLFVRLLILKEVSGRQSSMKSTDKRGNRQLIAICSMNIVLYIGTYFFYRTLNKRREKIWSEWSPQVNINLDLYRGNNVNAVSRSGTTGIPRDNRRRREPKNGLQICLLIGAYYMDIKFVGIFGRLGGGRF